MAITRNKKQNNIVFILFILIVVGIFVVLLLTWGRDEPTLEAACQEARGVWREFPNSCANSCSYERGDVDSCAQVLTFDCDCGEDMCWDGSTCVRI